MSEPPGFCLPCAAGQTAQEGMKINQSLTVLGRVIEALNKTAGKDGKMERPPYRDSVLTRVLQVGTQDLLHRPAICMAGDPTPIQPPCYQS